MSVEVHSKTGSQLSGFLKFFTVFSLANYSNIDLEWLYASTFFKKYNFQTENPFELPIHQNFKIVTLRMRIAVYGPVKLALIRGVHGTWKQEWCWDVEMMGC